MADEKKQARKPRTDRPSIYHLMGEAVEVKNHNEEETFTGELDCEWTGTDPKKFWYMLPGTEEQKKFMFGADTVLRVNGNKITLG